MNNQLIEIPDWNLSELNLVLSVSHIYDGYVVKTSTENPIYFPLDSRKKEFELLEFYSKFIFDGSLKLDNLKDLFLSIDKKYPEILKGDIISKFMSEHIERKEWKIKNKTSIIEVEFVKIRAQIISYLELKIGSTQEVEKLKESLTFDNKLSFKDFINKKSNFLLKLNLDGYINQLNNQTKQKINNRLNKERDKHHGLH